MLYNNTNKKWESGKDLYRGIVYIDQHYIEFGYFEPSSQNVPIYYNGRVYYLDNRHNCKIKLYWCNSSGVYSIRSRDANNCIINSKNVFYYPIDKCYNFSKLNLTPNKLEFNIDKIDKEFKNLSNFTFGLEYETSGGNIPWLECIDYNLVPLYDGSITGHEYVTFPLTYKDLPIIRTHFKLLRCYTITDKNCSLHIHFGGFPVTYDKIDALCKYWYYFQDIIRKYIPLFSYHVERYKDNGKAYNKPWPLIRSLSYFYNKYTNNDYVDDKSFLLPNQYDEEEVRKWEVHGRYYNMNIMHLLAGDSHKTVEFRFLRPTTIYSEIKWYILVLGAFLNYVTICNENKYKSISLDKVLDSTYSSDVVTRIKEEGMKLYHLRKIQISNKDYPGINEKLKYIYLNNLVKLDI